MSICKRNPGVSPRCGECGQTTKAKRAKKEHVKRLVLGCKNRPGPKLGSHDKKKRSAGGGRPRVSKEQKLNRYMAENFNGLISEYLDARATYRFSNKIAQATGANLKAVEWVSRAYKNQPELFVI